MPADGPVLLTLIRDSVAAPRQAAATVLRLRAPRTTILEGVVLLAALGSLLDGLTGSPAAAVLADGSTLVIGPFTTAVILAGSMILGATAIQVAGQLLGGRGHFDEALAIVLCLEIVALPVRLALALVAAGAPALSGAVGVVGIAVLLWCLVNFVHVLHGFDGIGRTVATLLLSTVIGLVGLTLLFGLMGGLGWVSNA